MKAKPTLYQGYKFRSKLEAKWAVFFDACKIRWEYEPITLECADGSQYTYDFYLPEVWTRGNKGANVEIKPNGPVDYSYLIRIASAIKPPQFLTMLFGDPFDAIPDLDNRNCIFNNEIGMAAGLWNCRNCGAYKFEHGYSHRECPKCRNRAGIYRHMVNRPLKGMPSMAAVNRRSKAKYFPPR